MRRSAIDVAESALLHNGRGLHCLVSRPTTSKNATYPAFPH
jgi:hypothetical protein